ncbi:hypothetical protein AAZX31_13G050800 [Glycine max]|uniref:Uncharacterized protein n=2 Tax=Glycine subgen. Soja TaxID=1462606 RepID=I1LWI2_SOYBN|nr:uncharacterized protein LOC100789744 [Glycine max]XP_028196073.1 uncharacterized protein LOC114381089 [Glycine soja]KAG4976136.1 hypothetical protein JHK86_035610 [Glycine max]KAG5112213.1 hypothetical protein JHK82_035482 [Glycine max]KAG5129491.1 hypothetical protein JHK84_035888 [Glycine max]KAH1100127.1 hypothetical protein GYH30_035341 [Glycine max]KAH1215756.1 hypothetical protein GmHk_13G036831 [Glycine max]|eukprot:XP_003543687.1 uncharacterized protein LOC100789744 [Glycine max]
MSSPLLPVATSSDAHAPNPRVLPLYDIFSFLSTTISSGIITYLAYTKNDTPMLLFAAFIYVVYFSVDFSPPPQQPKARGLHAVKLASWALLSSTMLGFACSFSTSLTPPESLCFFWVVLGGSALLHGAWMGDENFVSKKEQYADMVRSFAPIMLMFFGLGRHYLSTQLILHAAIMNARNLVRPTTICVNINTKQLSG